MSIQPPPDESATVSAEAIMAEIRAHLARTAPVRPIQQAEDNAASAAASAPTAATVPATRNASPRDDLYTHLHTARSLADVSQLPLAIADGTRGIGGALRLMLHKLVLYYVNMLAARQTAFNRAAVAALAHLTDQLERRDIERIAALEREVRELKAALRARDDTP